MVKSADDSAHGGGYNPDAGKVGKDVLVKIPDEHDPAEELAHVGKGTWYHAGYHIATTIATPAAFAPLPWAFSRLGWGGGIVSLAAAIFVTYYNSILLASLHYLGGKRNIRYRDLGRKVYGPVGEYSVIFFQQVASLGNNITVQIAAGLAMKMVYRTYAKTDADGNLAHGSLTLQHFIIIFGAIQWLLSQLPDIHSLRGLNLICTFCTAAFSAVAVGLSIDNGKDMPRSTVSYNTRLNPAVPDGSKTLTDMGFLFGIFSALGTIAFAFGDTILPEIQAATQAPAIKNTYKGVSLAFSLMAVTYMAVACAGYWAFGFLVNPWLPASFTGPTWAINMSNIFAIIQIFGCFQIYCRPTYEWVYIRIGDEAQPLMAKRNVVARVIVTTVYSVVVTLVACLIPFFGDFVALVGAIGFTPLDFILPVMLWTKVNDAHWSLNLFNYTLTAIYTVVGVLGAVGSIRTIDQHVKDYKVFADLG